MKTKEKGVKWWIETIKEFCAGAWHWFKFQSTWTKIGFSAAILAIIGWFLNIIKLIALIGDPLTSEVFVRLIGIPFVPIGIIAGWF